MPLHMGVVDRSHIRGGVNRSFLAFLLFCASRGLSDVCVRHPAWTSPAATDELVSAIPASSSDGLDPADYHLAAIERLRATTPVTPAKGLARSDGGGVHPVS
jgi:hypothetical protein